MLVIFAAVMKVIVMMTCHVRGDNADVMKTITFSFGVKINACLRELQFDDDVQRDLLYFWDPNYDLKNKLVGCTLICSLLKLHLLRLDGEIDDANTSAFIKASSGDSEMVDTLTKLYKACRKLSTATDPCVHSLDTFNCIRSSIQQSSWVPVFSVEDNFRKCGEDIMYIDVN